MEPKFWHERWELNEIGFHQNQTHPGLHEYWPQLGVTAGQVFVPLCGKSLDMVWLHRQGHAVLGVELSPIAVQDFFQEQGTTPTNGMVDDFQSFADGEIELLCGDFFDLQPKHLRDIKAVYDRAALIALPQDMQTQYAGHLLKVLPQRPPILLITFEYDQKEMQGPPFSVPEARVVALFGEAYRIDKLMEQELLEEYPGLKSRGLTGLKEKVYCLKPF